MDRLVLTFAFYSCFSLSLCTTVSVIKTVQYQPKLVTGYSPNAIVTSTYNNTYNKTGWSTLEIHGIPGNSNEDIAYFAGFIEGNQTGDLIYMTYINSINSNSIMCNEQSNTLFCERIKSFVQSNIEYMTIQIKNNPGSSYWHMVDMYLKQLDGLIDGYHSNTHLPVLSKNAFFFLQINNDLSNLQDAFNSGTFPVKFNNKIGDGKCSAFIKLLANNSDLLTSHDTWSEYESMLRIYKLYHLPYKTQSNIIIPGSAISMSSYPGKLQSEDDYYIINSGLVTMETTNGNNNPDLWSDLTSSAIFEPIRVMVSNRLSSTGKQWTETFARYNSGTYNNQWMIVDYNLFQPNTKLPLANVLWILEQLPGYIIYGDETRTLIKQTYWASYNIPYYSSIYLASGMSTLADKYGDWFTHQGSPRAKIFARNHTSATDMETLIRLMRYNNYKHDPLSVCNCTPPYSGENAISARSDLNPSNGVYPFNALSHRMHGGTDNKATNYYMVHQLSSLVTCGPTHDQQPVFKWSQSNHTKPLGHTDVFDFDTIKIQWNE